MKIIKITKSILKYVIKKKENNIFYIEPTGGLSNRIRTLLSAIYLANNYNKKLIVNWIENEELNCSFNNIFKPIPSITFINDWDFSQKIFSSHRDTFKKRTVTKLKNKIDYNINYSFKEKNKDNIKLLKDIDTVLNTYNNLYIQTCFNLIDNFQTQLYLLKPIEELTDKINLITQNFTTHTYGIHIRRTDHFLAIEKSNLIDFENKMTELIEKNSNSNFYLSTDDQVVEAYLKDKFKNRIITSEKVFNRNTVLGIQGALIDLYCLANTSKIYGSFFSSYSEMASYINNIDLEVLSNS